MVVRLPFKPVEITPTRAGTQVTPQTTQVAQPANPFQGAVAGGEKPVVKPLNTPFGKPPQFEPVSAKTTVVNPIETPFRKPTTEWQPVEPKTDTDRLFANVFPGKSISDVITYASTKPEDFLSDLQNKGWTQETDALIRFMLPSVTNEELQGLFGASAPFVPENWLKDHIIDPMNAMLHKIRQADEMVTYTILPNAIRQAFELSEWEISQLPASLEERQAVSELQKQNAESANAELMRRLKNLISEEQKWQNAHPELAPNPEYLKDPWKNTELFKDPGYYAYTISSSLPYTVATMTMMALGGTIGGPPGAMAAGTITAGLPEAADMLVELVDAGVPYDEAVRWAVLQGGVAGGIEMGSDYFLMGLMAKPFKPLTNSIANTLTKSLIGRIVAAGTTGLIATQTEGIEELLTQVSHNSILRVYDESQSILEGVAQAYINGVIGSMPFAGVGGFAQFRTFYNGLSGSTKEKYDSVVDKLVSIGFSLEEARIEATKITALQPEDREQVEAALQDAQAEFFYSQGVTTINEQTIADWWTDTGQYMETTSISDWMTPKVELNPSPREEGVFSIVVNEESIGAVATFPQEDSLFVNRISIMEEGTLTRSILVQIDNLLGNMAREQGKQYLRIAVREENLGLYKRAGYTQEEGTNIVRKDVSEYQYAPTFAMAEGETVSGEPIMGYGKRDAVGMSEAERIRRHIDILKRTPEKNAARIRELESLVAQLETSKAETVSPDIARRISDLETKIEREESSVNPDTAQIKAWQNEIKSLQKETGGEVAGEVAPEAESLAESKEGKAVEEVAGSPPKPPKNWGKVGGNFYDDFNNRITQNPTPNTMPASAKFRRGVGKVQKVLTDQFARLNKLGWEAEVALGMLKAYPGRAGELYRQTMVNVLKAIDYNNELLNHVNTYLILRHQLEVLKAIGGKHLTIKTKSGTKQYTAKQLGLLFASMKQKLGTENYEKVKKAASYIPALYNEILKSTDELTPDQIEGLHKKYPWYNPIAYEGDTVPINLLKGRKLTTRQIKWLTEWDTDKRILDPLIVLPSSIMSRIEAQAKNKAIKEVADAAIKPENRAYIGGEVEIVNKAPTGPYIDFWDEGTHRYLKLGKGAEWIAEDIKLIQTQPISQTIRMVRALQNLSKATFTTYNPGFMAWNTMFDAMTSFFAEGVKPHQFASAWVSLIKSLFTDVERVNVFRMAGGEQLGFFSKGAEIGASREVTPYAVRQKGELHLKNPHSLKRFINPFVLIREMGEAGENAARLVAFENAKKEGLSDDQAALRGRRVTVDFSRYGTAAKQINNWYIYFNAGLQGFLLPGRAIAKNPRSLWRLAILIGAYTALTFYNQGYDEYPDVRDSDKIGKLLIMLPSNEYNQYGQKVPHYITLMPLREFAMFTAPIEYLLGKLRTDSPETYRIWGQEWDSFYPIISPLSMITETGGFVVPTQIGATIQQIVQNHDDFRNKPIIDDELSILPPAQQYDQYTNSLAIKIGQAINVSPKKLDFFVSNMFGSMGQDLLRTINEAITDIDNEMVDERIAGLVEELRAIPTQVPPNQIEVARETFLEGLSVEDRDLVLNMERIPEEKLPFIESLISRFYRDYGGQVYQTAKEKALMNRDINDYPQEALEELQEAAVLNANNLLSGDISKYQYDEQRSSYRAYYSGASTAQWREAMIEGGVARSDVDEYMPESYQRAEEFQAVSAYMEIRQKYIDEAGGVLDSGAWDSIEAQTITELHKHYSETAVQYAIAHKDDWIDNLPEPARTVERDRAKAIENGTWWDNYRGSSSSDKYTLPWTTNTPSTSQSTSKFSIPFAPVR